MVNALCSSTVRRTVDVDVIVIVDVIDRRDRGRARDSGTITVGVADTVNDAQRPTGKHPERAESHVRHLELPTWLLPHLAER